MLIEFELLSITIIFVTMVGPQSGDHNSDSESSSSESDKGQVKVVPPASQSNISKAGSSQAGSSQAGSSQVGSSRELKLANVQMRILGKIF